MVTPRARTAIAFLVLLASMSARADGLMTDAPAPPFNWTGLYVGYHTGGGMGISDISDPAGGTLFGNPVRSPGPMAGGQIGYNYQTGSVVWGVEADVSWADMEGTGTCSALSGTFVNSNCLVTTDAFGTLAGRLGLVLGPDDRALIYGKAGAAWSSGSVYAATSDNVSGAAGNPFTNADTDMTLWGWIAGAGAEYALSSKWSVKAEYDYIGFGSHSVTLLPSAFLAGGAITSSVGPRQGSIDQDLHVFKLGMNYSLADRALPPEPQSALGGFRGFGFELGSRYWYSWGKHQYDLGQLKSAPAPAHSLVSRLTYDNLETNAAEITARIDAPWQLFAKGFIGTGSTTSGRMSDEDFNIDNNFPYTRTRHQADGEPPAYATIDLGYDWFRAPSYRVGSYVGYSYFHEAIDAHGCVQTANPLGPCGVTEGSIPASGHAVITQSAVWQSVRLGAAAEFYLAPRLKLSGDAAYLPYVHVAAQDDHFQGNTPNVASINPLRGHGVGTQLEAMLSYDVTEQLSFGVGARYWAMWTTDAHMIRTFDFETPVTAPPPQQDLRMQSDRAGFLGQVLYKFD
jgi:opacity protein-like surface antigen/outer membrane protease